MLAATKPIIWWPRIIWMFTRWNEQIEGSWSLKWEISTMCALVYLIFNNKHTKYVWLVYNGMAINFRYRWINKLSPRKLVKWFFFRRKNEIVVFFLQKLSPLLRSQFRWDIFIIFFSPVLYSISLSTHEVFANSIEVFFWPHNLWFFFIIPKVMSVPNWMPRAFKHHE